MKKGSHVLTFLLLCAAAGAAQTTPPTAADAPANVAVVKFNWERIPRRSEWDAPVSSAVNQKIDDPRPGPVPAETSDNRAPAPFGRSTSSSQRERERSQASRDSTSAAGGERPGSNASQSRPASGVADYVYQLRITNGGKLRVEGVDWEYLFLDPGTKQELGRHRFLSPRRAKPGETFTLKGESLSPPTRVVPAGSLDKKRKPFDERVVVRCVAYADGTFARREGAAEADCDSLREATARAERRRKPQ